MGSGIYDLYSDISKITGTDENFRPHITIGRVKEKFTVPDTRINSEKYLIEKVCLYSSLLKSTGAEYTEICCNQLM